MAKNPVRILAPGGCAAQDVVQAARSAAIESLKKARISPDQAETLATRIAMACFAGLNRNGEQAVARAIREIAGQYIAANQGAKKTGIDNVIVQYGLDMPPISRYGSSPGRNADSRGRNANTDAAHHSHPRSPRRPKTHEK
ncbi:MAG: hypothetical protein EYC62_05260 [Alphaproteobacteria bacterium]|nr:MAG: hypothetical protein EYC62_05260 [Alphaproteobacteria bacterium]